MTSGSPERELDRLREAAARISNNLVELEIDPVRRTIETSPLRGESAACWATANAGISELWRRQGLLEGFIERADGLRGFRRAGELRALLNSPSIELTDSDVPLSQRDLVASATLSARCSPQELIAAMASIFDEVKLVIARFDAAWDALRPRLDAAQKQLGEARRLAEGLGEEATRELEDVSRAVAALSDLVTTDPLAVAMPDLERMEASVATIHGALQGVAELRRDLVRHLRDARALLERVRAAIHEAREARSRLERRIVVADDETAPSFNEGDLAGELTRVIELTEAEAWARARVALERWTVRAESRLAEAARSTAASRAPVEARNQLRGLLDAYQVKAKRTGCLEDPDIAQLFDRAHASLHTAPTDLAMAAKLVRAYQRAVSDPVEVNS